MIPGGSKTVILFGKERLGADRDSASSPALSPDAKHVAWKFRAGGKSGVAVDAGKEARASHDQIIALAWRPDGKELAFVACDGGKAKAGLMGSAGEVLYEGGTWTVVRRAASGKETAEPTTWSEIADLAWSESGTLAYAAKDAQGWHIVCGTAKSAAFDEVGVPRIAADAKSVGFGARRKRELLWSVLTVE
jgi:hypothetical protein